MTTTTIPTTRSRAGRLRTLVVGVLLAVAGSVLAVGTAPAPASASFVRNWSEILVQPGYAWFEVEEDGYARYYNSHNWLHATFCGEWTTYNEALWLVAGQSGLHFIVGGTSANPFQNYMACATLEIIP